MIKNLNTHKYSGQSGVYVSIVPFGDSIKQIHQLVSSLEPPFDMDSFKEKAHQTLMYSRNKTIGLDNIQNIHKGQHVVSLANGFEFWDGHDNDGYLVLKLISYPSMKLHDTLKSLGAQHSFDEYSPHITIASKLDNNDAMKNWLQKANDHINKKPMIVHYDTMNIEDCKQ